MPDYPFQDIGINIETFDQDMIDIDDSYSGYSIVGDTTTITFGNSLDAEQLLDLTNTLDGHAIVYEDDEGASNPLQDFGVDLSEYVKKSEVKNIGRINNAGRFYLVNNRWVTDGDDNYGPNYYQFSEAAGTGANPDVEWEHKGFLVNKGDVIKRLNLVGRVNNTQVTDLDIELMFKRPDPLTRWGSGIDSDGEIFKEVMTDRFLFKDKVDGYSGNMNDDHRALVDVDYVAPEDGFISIYMRPVGALTGTRYFPCNYMWEIEYA